MQLGDKLEPEPFAESGVGLLPVWEQGFGAGMSAMGSWGAALEQLVPLPSLFPGRFLLAPGPGRGPDLSPGEGPLGVRGTSAGQKGSMVGGRVCRAEQGPGASPPHHKEEQALVAASPNQPDCNQPESHMHSKEQAKHAICRTHVRNHNTDNSRERGGETPTAASGRAVLLAPVTRLGTRGYVEGERPEDPGRRAR